MFFFSLVIVTSHDNSAISKHLFTFVSLGKANSCAPSFCFGHRGVYWECSDDLTNLIRKAQHYTSIGVKPIYSLRNADDIDLVEGTNRTLKNFFFDSLNAYGMEISTDKNNGHWERQIRYLYE